jgi:probable phosphoglycerate mutase
MGEWRCILTMLSFGLHGRPIGLLRAIGAQESLVRKSVFAAAVLVAAVQAAPGSAATFLFIRHAESTANAGTATTVEEVVNPPLTNLGQQQAQTLRTVLATYDITDIYTSAYQRTQLTIAPTAADFGLTPVSDARTNEWYFGDLTSPSDLYGPAVYGVIGAWIGGNTAAKLNLPNAESLDDVVARVIPAWEEIINQHKDEDGVVVLVGHGVSTGYVLPYFARNVSTQFAFANSLKNTGIVELKLINDQPYVTRWQGAWLAVPEPSNWAMMIGGFGLVGAMMRRRRVAAAHA